MQVLNHHILKTEWHNLWRLAYLSIREEFLIIRLGWHFSFLQMWRSLTLSKISQTAVTPLLRGHALAETLQASRRERSTKWCYDLRLSSFYISNCRPIQKLGGGGRVVGRVPIHVSQSTICSVHQHLLAILGNLSGAVADDGLASASFFAVVHTSGSVACAFTEISYLLYS